VVFIEKPNLAGQTGKLELNCGDVFACLAIDLNGCSGYGIDR
jgi:hypothetical protein